MDVETFSEWLRRQGHRVVETESARWFDRAPRTFLAFPWHRMIRPSREELVGLLRKERAIALRFSAPPDDAAGADGYDVLLDTPTYDLTNVSRSTRPVVRKALERCEIITIDSSGTREKAGSSRSTRGGDRGVPASADRPRGSGWRARRPA